MIATVIDPRNPDNGEAVQGFAERARTSTRTVYRCLSGRAGEAATTPPSMLLDVSDRLVTAAGRHLSECRVITPDGQVVDYTDF